MNGELLSQHLLAWQPGAFGVEMNRKAARNIMQEVKRLLLLFIFVPRVR